MMNERAMVRLPVIGVAAMARNRVIGNGPDLPWPRNNTDFQHFKDTTLNGAVVYGTGTLPSMRNRALSNRLNLGITRDRSTAPAIEGITWTQSFHEAFMTAARQKYEKVFMIGGQQIFEQGLKYCDELVLTEFDLEACGDKVFPPLPAEEWEEVSREPFHDKASNWGGHFVTYRSKRVKPVVTYPRNARDRKYWSDLVALNMMGECPFCDGGKTHLEQKIIYDHPSWWVSENIYAYGIPGAERQFLLVPRGRDGKHPTRYEHLSSAHHHILSHSILPMLHQKFGVDQAPLTLRNGPLVGSTVEHLHFQYTVPKPGETIQLYFGAYPLDAEIPEPAQ